MKKIISTILIVIILTSIFLSCSHSDRENRLARVDTLSMVLAKVDSMLKFDIQYDSIMLKYNELKINKEALSPILLKMNQKEKSDYLQYTSSEKQFKIIIAAYENYKNELEISRKQVTDLKNDFENRVIKKDKFEAYYASENKAVYLLFNSVKTDVYKTKKHFEKFNYFQPVIEELMIKKGLKKAAVVTEG